MDSRSALTAQRARFRGLFESREFLFGSWVHWCRTPTIMQMLRTARFDFAVIDTQHSGLSWETIGDMCQMARECAVLPIIRPYEHSRGLAVRLRDIGAMGLMFPHVERPDQVRDFWDWLGDENRDENFLMLIQIERADAIPRLDAILASGRVDVVEIGRHDMANSLGLPPYESMRHPKVLDAVDRVIDGCNRRGVATAVNAYGFEDAADMMARGVQCFTWASERLVLQAAYNDASVRLHELAAAARRA